ncbi:GAF and ANTAR domain-containing protein [Streptomyces sp. CBMA152]|uniref:GAF and ANTAR domain-containing protein n=1 Tax=Streptomyces sp. CBMA152 TaxID=1896312 RepID=UPI001661391C|nr:GAF and ANTAR domain-containing protein [Streptomyces sp. CBMA152]
MTREEKIAQTFVELADTLVNDFDVIDFLQQLTVRCHDLFAADAVVLLAYPDPQYLHSPAPCDPHPALSRMVDLALHEGPALDAYRTAAPVMCAALADAPGAWSHFASQASDIDYASAFAVPMRLREETIGSLLLLSADGSPLRAADLVLAQAFADAATIGLLHARTVQHVGTVNAQLHTALQSRIVIEQAKGYLAAQRAISPNNAFDAMRRHARRHSTLLTTVAQHVLATGGLPASTPTPTPTSSPALPAPDHTFRKQRQPGR